MKRKAEAQAKEDGGYCGFCDLQDDVGSILQVVDEKEYGLFNTIKTESKSNLVICLFKNHVHPVRDSTLLSKFEIDYPEFFVEFLRSDNFDTDNCALQIDFRTWTKLANYLMAPTYIFDKLVQHVNHDQDSFNPVSLFTLWSEFGVQTLNANNVERVCKLLKKQPRYDEYCIAHDMGKSIFEVGPWEEKNPGLSWIWDSLPKGLMKNLNEQHPRRVYVAGGSCIPQKTGITMLESSNIDFFIIKSRKGSNEAAALILKAFHDDGYIICSKLADREMIAVAPPDRGLRNVRILNSTQPSIQALLRSFDIGATQWASDGIESIHSILAMRQLQTKTIEYVGGKYTRYVRYRLKGFDVQKMPLAPYPSNIMREFNLYNYPRQFANLSLEENIWQLKRQSYTVQFQETGDGEFNISINGETIFDIANSLILPIVADSEDEFFSLSDSKAHCLLWA